MEVLGGGMEAGDGGSEEMSATRKDPHTPLQPSNAHQSSSVPHTDPIPFPTLNPLLPCTPLGTFRVFSMLGVVFLLGCVAFVCMRGVWGAGGTLEVVVEGSTEVLENGVSGFPSILGLSVYGGRVDFENASSVAGERVLGSMGVDALGFYAWLPDLLPPDPRNLSSLAALEAYLQTGEPAERFKSQSGDARVLNSGLLQAHGAQFWAYLDEFCLPAVPHSICPHGGAPNRSEYAWFAALMAAWVREAQKTAQMHGGRIRFAHILNEPNAHFWTTGANVSDYVAFARVVVASIKAQDPGVLLGGPTIYCGPMASSRDHPPWAMWEQWAKPVLDAAILDFFDFHAYNESAVPVEVEAALALVHMYSSTTRSGPLQSAISETDFCLASAEERHTYGTEWQFRGILHAETILRLWQHPDKVLSRHIFDYAASGKACFYNVNSSSPTTSRPSATQDTLSLLSTLFPPSAPNFNHSAIPRLLSTTSSPTKPHTILTAASKPTPTSLSILLLNPTNSTVQTSLSIHNSPGTFLHNATQLTTAGLNPISPSLPSLPLPALSLTSLFFTTAESYPTKKNLTTEYPSSTFMTNFSTTSTTSSPSSSSPSASITLRFPTLPSPPPPSASVAFRFGVKAPFLHQRDQRGHPGPTIPVSATLSLPCTTPPTRITLQNVTAYNAVPLPCTPNTIDISVQANATVLLSFAAIALSTIQN